MPIAGNGSRFNRGFKPFIEVEGKKLLEWSIASLGDLSNHELCFVIKESDDKLYQVNKTLKELYPKCLVVTLEKETQGTLETCSLALKQFQGETPLVVLDCDLYFESSFHEKLLQKLNWSSSYLLTFKSQEPCYSYCYVKNGKVEATAEKEVISDSAIAGCYNFSSINLFKKYANEIIFLKKIVKNEYYISQIINELIKAGHDVRAIQCEKYFSLGTPAEVESNYKNLSSSK